MPRDPRAHQLRLFAANGAALSQWGGIVKDLRPKQAGQVQALGCQRDHAVKRCFCHQASLVRVSNTCCPPSRPEGFKLNPALLTYVTSVLPARPARRRGPRRERRVSKRLEAETIERIVAEYVAGATAAQLGRQYRIAKSSVLGLVRQSATPVRHRRFSARETGQLVALYEAGLSQKDIAERLGRSSSAVWHCLRQAGLVGPRRDS
jgi:Winged helix-turn-helix DNA-binding